MNTSEILAKNPWLSDAYSKILQKLDTVSVRSADKIPYSTVNGTHDDMSTANNGNSINWWTNGFFGGLMWLAYHETGDAKYLNVARNISSKISVCFEKFYSLDHDLGFLWMPTDVADYRLTDSADGRRRGLIAANFLAGRFNPVANYIRAWNDGIGKENSPTSNVGWCIIDCLMNLPLLYWASDETHDPRFKAVAQKHADMALKNFLREDGSVNHIVELNPNTGEFVAAYGGQGYGEGSSWTRGQGWALYGFTLSYIHTHEQRYLDAAVKVARYFISQIPEDGLIPVDFRQPETPRFEDSTAACIASCGLIELSKIIGGDDGDFFLQAALKMLKALTDNRCDFSLKTDNIVNYCSARYHEPNHHYSIIYGDFYYAEAIFKLAGKDFLIW